MIIIGKDNPYIGLEKYFQESAIKYLRIKGYFCIHVPNGGSRNIKEAVNLKKQGVLAGVCDILILDKNIAIELKVKGGKLSEHQISFIERLEKSGWECVVCYSLDSLIKYFEK